MSRARYFLFASLGVFIGEAGRPLGGVDCGMILAEAEGGCIFCIPLFVTLPLSGVRGYEVSWS